MPIAIIPGSGIDHVFLDPGGAHWYVGDGWGRPYPGLRIRSFSVSGGEEQASALLRDGLRAVTFPAEGSTMLAATDYSLFLLRRKTLEVQQRWRARIPRYADSIVAVGRVAATVNWLAPWIRLVNLDSGVVRRRRVGEGLIIDRLGRDRLLVCARKEGRLVEVDPASLQIREVARVQPLVTMSLDDEAGSVWISPGDPFIHRGGNGVTWTEFPPTNQVVELGLRDLEPRREARLPEPLRRMKLVTDSGTAWTDSVDPEPVDPHDAHRIWRAVAVSIWRIPEWARIGRIPVPDGYKLLDFFPDHRIIFVARDRSLEETEILWFQV